MVFSFKIAYSIHMERILEPEVMDTLEEAESYDAMDHCSVNAAFIDRLIELGVNGSCLDIGCGPGHIPLELVTLVSDVHITAIDLSRNMLKIASEHQKVCMEGARVDFVYADAKTLQFDSDSFDSVYSNSILHHIPNPADFLSEAWRVLKPNGVLLIRDLFRPQTKEDALKLVKQYADAEEQQAQDLFFASLCAALRPEELVDIVEKIGVTDYKVVVDTDRHMSLQISAHK
jgi:ubiquinone/menaquinone biosynthesis C-methylase UbiE